jgi:DNA polymerase elongation subunit (family B)
MKFYTNITTAGNRILVRAYENGERINYRVNYSPKLYTLSKNPTDYKSLDGRYLNEISPGSMNDCRDFIKTYEDVEGFEIHGNTKYIYQYINEMYNDEIRFDSSLIRTFTLDIETAAENGFPNIETADQEILLISILDNFSNRIMVWGSSPYNNTDKQVDYNHCDDERKLLISFLQWWQENCPDVITGWNVQFFDMPYICNRMNRILGEEYTRLLSPWKYINTREVFAKGRKQISKEISGISILDYLDLYKKFTYINQESYRLDHIAFVELGEKKLDHSEFDTFKEFYNGNWQKFVVYNIHDVRLVGKLDDKMKLMELAFTMSYDAKINYEDVYSQIRMWDNIIYVYLSKENIIIPPKRTEAKNNKYAGAFVKEPKPGLYDWIVNFDLQSLYPHLIMQYNLSPETLLEKRSNVTVDMLIDKKFDTSELDGENLCANGTHYTTKFRGFLPKLMEKIYQERTIYKKKMLVAKQEYERNPTIELQKEISRCNNIQMARKIQLNSAYGAIGNEHFRYYKLEIAEAITISGQLSIRWIEKKLNSYLNGVLKTNDIDYVIAIDTDSVYLNMGPFVDAVYKGRKETTENIVSFLDKVCKMELNKYIESSYQELADYLKAYDQMMIMKRENIAERGFWTGKKRYVLNVWDSEGVRYSQVKMKITGMETARSSTPAYFRDKLLESYKYILNKTNDELIEYINTIREDIRKQDYIDIAFPRGVNGLKKYHNSADIYSKGTPIQVRGALLYNHYIKKKNLEHKYPLIQEGEKIKFVYLKTPNPIGENTIAFFQQLPKELNLEKYIDYTMQFEKSFLEPLKNVLDCIEWEYERRGSLTSFFS